MSTFPGLTGSSPSVPKVYMLKLELPVHVYESLLAESERAGKSIETLIIDRLVRCKDHNSLQPIYFNDKERNELVRLLGGHLLSSAEHALQRIRHAMQLKVNGATVQLTERELSRIKSRSRKDRTQEQVLQSVVKSLIDSYLRGEVDARSI